MGSSRVLEHIFCCHSVPKPQQHEHSGTEASLELDGVEMGFDFT